MRSPSLDGRQLGLFGRQAALVNRSLSQGSAEVLPTSDTSGLCSSGSSRSAALQRSLANKLHQNLDVTGSLEYSLTWKAWAMPAREPICALRASGRRTSGNDSSGWPTPNAADSWVPETTSENTLRRGKMDGALRSTSGNLAKDVAAKIAGWGTPSATERSGQGPDNVSLMQQARLAGWATPQSRDWHGGSVSQETMNHNTRPLNEQVVQLTPLPTQTSTSSSASTAKLGALNPAFSRWLMGLPSSWDQAAPLQGKVGKKSLQDTETASCLK